MSQGGGGMGMEAMIGGAVGGAIGMGVDAHVRGQNWSRQKNVLQKKYRWAVRDLKAAGLNPILAATGGISPGTAPSLTGSSSRLGADTAAGIAAGTGAKRVKSEVSKNTALTEAAEAQGFKAREEGLNAIQQREFIRYSAEKAASEARGAAAAADIMESRVPEMQALEEMWMDPVQRWILQQKYLLQGTPLLRWNPNQPGGPTPNSDRPRRKPKDDWRGPPIKGRKGRR